MQDEAILAEFLSIVDRIGISDIEAGVLARMSPHTVRFCRATHQLPKRARCVEQMRAFVELNRTAGARGELRLVA